LKLYSIAAALARTVAGALVFVAPGLAVAGGTPVAPNPNLLPPTVADCLAKHPIGVAGMGYTLAQAEQICHFTATQGNRDVVIKNESGLVLRVVWTADGNSSQDKDFTLGESDEEMLDGSQVNTARILYDNQTPQKGTEWVVVGSSPPLAVGDPCTVRIPNGPGKTVIVVKGVMGAPTTQSCAIQ
jgi:hypothetical protein